MNGAGNWGHKIEEFLRQSRVITQLSDFADNSAADHNAIRPSSNLSGLGRIGDTETHYDGQRSVVSNLAHTFRDRTGQVITLTGHTLPRNIVNETAGLAGDRPNPFLRRCGCDQPDSVDQVRMVCVCGFFRRQVQQQNAVDPGSKRVFLKLRKAILEYWVQIAVQNDRHTDLGPDLRNRVEQSRQRCPGFKCPLRAQLIGDPVGQRVGEPYPNLQDIGPSSFQGRRYFNGFVQARVAACDIHNEGASIFYFESGKLLVNPVCHDSWTEYQIADSK